MGGVGLAGVDILGVAVVDLLLLQEFSWVHSQ